MTARPEFESDGKGEEYKIKAICDSMVYARESEGHLLGLYYLVSWKGYTKEKNTWEPVSAVIYLRKLISNFHHDHPEKPTATFPPINSASLMARSTVKPRAETLSKQKWDKLTKDNSASKHVKKTWTSNFYPVFGPVLIVDKRFPQSHDPAPLRPTVWFFDSFHSSILTHLSVFPPRHRPGGFFY